MLCEPSEHRAQTIQHETNVDPQRDMPAHTRIQQVQNDPSVLSVWILCPLNKRS